MNTIDNPIFLGPGNEHRPRVYFWSNHPDLEKAKEIEQQWAYGNCAMSHPEQYDYIDGKWKTKKIK